VRLVATRVDIVRDCVLATGRNHAYPARRIAGWKGVLAGNVHAINAWKGYRRELPRWIHPPHGSVAVLELVGHMCYLRFV
jgi:hypothetical protein